MTTALPEQLGDADTYKPAPWWNRVGASILDGLLVNVLVGVCAGLASIDGVPTVVAAVALIAIVGLLFLYAPLMLAFSEGQTLGKSVAGVKVVNADGTAVGFGRALVRETVIKLIFGLLLLPWLVSVLWPIRDEHNRALHDLLARTRVVRRPVQLVEGPEQVNAQDSEWLYDDDIDINELDPITKRALRRQGRIR